MKAQTTTWATKPEMIIATSACRPRTKHRSHDVQKDLVREVFIFTTERKAHTRALARWVTRLVGFLPFIRTGRPANEAQDGAQNQQPPEKCGTPSSRRPSQDAAYVLAVVENPAVLDRLVEETGIPKEVFHKAASRWRELGYPDLESLRPSSLGSTSHGLPSTHQ